MVNLCAIVGLVQLKIVTEVPLRLEIDKMVELDILQIDQLLLRHQIGLAVN